MGLSTDDSRLMMEGSVCVGGEGGELGGGGAEEAGGFIYQICSHRLLLKGKSMESVTATLTHPFTDVTP